MAGARNPLPKPSVDLIFRFINSATEIAEGKRQQKLIGPLAEQTANLFHYLDEVERFFEGFKVFLENKRLNYTQEADAYSSEWHQGAADTCQLILKYLESGRDS